MIKIPPSARPYLEDIEAKLKESATPEYVVLLFRERLEDTCRATPEAFGPPAIHGVLIEEANRFLESSLCRPSGMRRLLDDYFQIFKCCGLESDSSMPYFYRLLEITDKFLAYSKDVNERFLSDLLASSSHLKQFVLSFKTHQERLNALLGFFDRLNASADDFAQKYEKDVSKPFFPESDLSSKKYESEISPATRWSPLSHVRIAWERAKLRGPLQVSASPVSGDTLQAA